MSQATITSKGQLTIPADIRKALGLEKGGLVEFTHLPDGTTIMRRKTRSVLELNGLLQAATGSQRKVPIASMNIGRR